MAKLTQQTITDTRATEQTNAKRQAEHQPPEPAVSARDHSIPPQEVTPIDPFDHAVKDLEAVVPSAKK